MLAAAASISLGAVSLRLHPPVRVAGIGQARKLPRDPRRLLPAALVPSHQPAHVAHSRCGDMRHAGLLFHGTPRQDVLKSARVPIRELFFGSYRLKELPFQSRSLNIKLERKKKWK